MAPAQPDRPQWVVNDLAAVIGLDAESVTQLILPDLEGYTNETRLKAHLQSFLGPSPPAKAFVERYVALRFPRLPSLPAPAPPAGPTKPPSQYKSKTQPLFSQPATYSGSARPAPDIKDALETAFGPGGKVYQKNRDADDLSGFGTGASRSASGAGHARVGGAGGVAGGSASGSGAQTPARRAGAVTITEAKTRPASTTVERASGRGKQREEMIWDLPKSAKVKRLEALLHDLKTVQAGAKVARKDTHLDCFCQARLHPLSPHTPTCPSCGLIQCHLQPPTSPCPSCAAPLLSPSALVRAIQRAQGDIDAQLAREQDARDAVEAQRLAAVQAEAAFPSLGPGGPGSSAGGSMAALMGRKEEGRKVLTIGAAGKGGGKGKGKGKVTLTTTTMIHAPLAEMELEEVFSGEVVSRPRVGPLERSKAEKEVGKWERWREEEGRPFGDMKAVKRANVGAGAGTGTGMGAGTGTGAGGGGAQEDWTYVPLPIVVAGLDERVGRRKAKRGGGVGGRSVPGAAAVSA